MGEIRREAVTDWLDEQGIRDPMDRQLYRRILTAADREYVDAVATKQSGKPPPADPTAELSGDEGE